MTVLNLNNADKLHYGATEVQKLYKGNQLLYPTADPYWNNVVLYLKGDGENNSTSIFDSSPTPKTITKFGDTKISTAKSKYGSSSIYFDGTNSYLQTDPINFQQSNFTIEFWVNILTLRDCVFLSHEVRPDSVNRQYFCRFKFGSEIEFGLYPNDTFISANFNPVLNTWYHIAFVRNINSINIYVNGILLVEGSYSFTLNSLITPLIIGASNNNGTIDRLSHCYFDSIRITEEIARYTTNFDPETDTYLAY